MTAVLRTAGEACHRLMASSYFTARLYFHVLPYVSRRLGPKAQMRLRNSINSVGWPEIPLRPHVVLLGQHTQVKLHPHFREFDLEVALSRRLNYEQEAFAFLETQMPNYRTVIEIGANVGVFTVFFARWLAERTVPGKVFAFEPSGRAYERLLQNVRINECGNVTTFNCAVGDQIGFVTFFEPEGHLTNGSLDISFANQFSSEVKAVPALVVDGGLLESLAGLEDRVLLKIDTEGAEAQVLRSLEHFIHAHQPDIVVEVLPQYEATLNELSFLKTGSYRCFNITSQGLVPQTRLVAGAFRDYFLTTSPGAIDLTG